MSQETSTNNSNESQLSAEEDALIIERQNFMLGCEEMERITDDIIAPVFQRLTGAFRQIDPKADLILMDCESPLDEQLYNVGVRMDFLYKESEVVVSIVADPSDFTFTLTTEGATTEPISHEFKYHEVTPRTLNNVFQSQITEHFTGVTYVPIRDSSDDNFGSFTAPFRVQYDDAGNVSDVATTKTLLEAANMGSTFAKMFKNEAAITIVDAKDNIVC